MSTKAGSALSVDLQACWFLWKGYIARVPSRRYLSTIGFRHLKTKDVKLIDLKNYQAVTKKFKKELRRRKGASWQKYSHDLSIDSESARLK